MKRLRLGISVLAMLGLLVSAAWAADPAKPAPAPRPWAPMGTSFGPSGSGMPAGILGVGGNFQYGESENVRKYGGKMNDSVSVQKATEVFKLRYGIMEGLDIRSSTPIYNIHVDRQAGSDRTNYGVGDTTILLHSVILNQDKGDPFYLAVDYGGSVPTASVGDHSVDAIGNDAWGLMGGVGATYFLDSHRFDMEVNYATFTEGAHDYTKGDRARWNVGYAYAINTMFDIGVESNFEWNDESELHGSKQKDASYEWYAGPKLVYKCKPWGVNFAVAGMLPLERWYQNTKTGSDDYRFMFKVIKFFDVGTFFD
ncbi:transporter [Desulfovibrio aminophilus]|nr:transporter [Desulfovibrio aminophilus]MCM0756910.1 transporter [Desulfovibrio aminophilus]